MEMIGYKISFLRCQKITIATYVLNVLIPSKGGDFAKCISLKDTVSISKRVGICILHLCCLFIANCTQILLMKESLPYSRVWDFTEKVLVLSTEMKDLEKSLKKYVVSGGKILVCADEGSSLGTEQIVDLIRLKGEQ